MDPMMVGLPILQCWRQTEQRAGRGACEDWVLNRQLFVLERPAVFPGLYAGIRLAMFPPLRPLGGVGGLGAMVLKVCPAFFLQGCLTFFRLAFFGGIHIYFLSLDQSAS